ncbi:hypothetical protein ACWESM_34840 [Nocardia sp. NPDC003999]
MRIEVGRCVQHREPQCPAATGVPPSPPPATRLAGAAHPASTAAVMVTAMSAAALENLRDDI